MQQIKPAGFSKRARDSSLMETARPDGGRDGQFSVMCPDITSACYSTHGTPKGCAVYLDLEIVLRYCLSLENSICEKP